MDAAIVIVPIHILTTALHHYTSAMHVKSMPHGSYPRLIPLSSAIDWISSLRYRNAVLNQLLCNVSLSNSKVLESK